MRNMKKIECIAMLLLACTPLPSHSVAVAANGGTLQYPEGGVQPGWLGMRYDFSWYDEPNPDYKPPCRSNCFLGPAPRDMWLDKESVYNPQSAKSAIPFTRGDTLGDIRKRYIERFGVSGSVNEPFWGYVIQIPEINWDTICIEFQTWETAGYSRGRTVPGAVCGRVSPPNVTCTPLTDMAFNFGTISAGTSSGLRRTVSQRVSCSNASSVSLRLVTPLRLSARTEANLTVNSRSVDTFGTSFDIIGDGLDLTFEATLVGNETVGGTYTASSVLIMEYR
jgi:hypothetical protein